MTVTLTLLALATLGEVTQMKLILLCIASPKIAKLILTNSGVTGMTQKVPMLIPLCS